VAHASCEIFYGRRPLRGRNRIRPVGVETEFAPKWPEQVSPGQSAAPPWVEKVTRQRSPERAKQYAPRTIERSENQRHDCEGVFCLCAHKPPGFGATLPDGRVSDVHSCNSLCRPFRAWLLCCCLPRAALRGWRRFAVPWAGVLGPLRGEKWFPWGLGKQLFPSVHSVALRAGGGGIGGCLQADALAS